MWKSFITSSPNNQITVEKLQGQELPQLFLLGPLCYNLA
ncbi:hypothetical protein AR1Y2_2783 [Anaerostipes rhamnosivorans]|uniref:Uncharacterized protein n=1 Tax=Anaerostipes rhamnosivorans TaxID=1229621 RepID=A0A4P8IHE5_9FIRM|nr:hypothetical protein AR1Y2_2783 [Anaerostipes rhamnosivorans]